MRKYVAALVFCLLCGLLGGLLVSGVLWAQSAGGAKRRPPPKSFDKSVEEAFFKDVVKQHGEGKFADVFASSGKKATPGGGVVVDVVGKTGDANSGWSKIITPETLENEIKAAIIAAGPNVESKPKWNTGHRKIRMLYSTLSMCFGVIAEYDGTVKFQKDAVALRDALAKSAANSKTNNEQAMIEAKKLLGELVELRNGAATALKPGDGGKPYGVTEVAEVMKRMQLATAPEAEDSKGIERWTSDAARFKAGKTDVIHEAEVLGMLAHVLQNKTTFDQAAEPKFAKYAADIQAASQEIVTAAKTDNYNAARAAAGVINKACTGCHTDYRD